MSRRGIIGAGNWIVDRVKIVDRWPEQGKLCNILSQVCSGGGGPCNVLFDLAAMTSDLPLYAAGVIGEDEDGDFLLDRAQTKSVDTRYLTRCPEVSTAYTDVMTSALDGRRTFFHHRGANAKLSYKELARIDVPARLFYLGYLLLLDGLDAPDSEYGTVAARVLSEMQGRGYTTVVDIVSEDSTRFQEIVLPALKYVDYLVVNEIEAGACCGKTVRGRDDRIDYALLSDCADSLLRHGVGAWVVVHYPEGVTARSSDGRAFSCSSWAIETQQVVGTVGAGDAFCAGLLYGIHENTPMEEALDLASASAWFNLQYATASDGAPSLARLLDFVNARPARTESGMLRT